MAKKTGKRKTLPVKRAKKPQPLGYLQKKVVRRAMPLLQLVVMRKTVKRKKAANKQAKKARTQIRLVYVSS